MSNRIEQVAVELFSAKGAQVKVAAFIATVGALAVKSYTHSIDKEQWQGKGSAARPLRGPWLAAFTPGANGKLPSTAVARAFREVAAIVVSALDDKARDKTDVGQDIFEGMVYDIAANRLAPASTPREEKPQAEKDAAALAKAVGVVAGAGTALTQAQADSIRAALAAFDAMQAASATSAATVGKVQRAPSESKPAAPAPAAMADDAAPSAMAQALAAALA